MTLRPIITLTTAVSFPRVSGDDPSDPPAVTVAPMFSPRERG